jgi:hypothetical protein
VRLARAGPTPTIHSTCVPPKDAAERSDHAWLKLATWGVHINFDLSRSDVKNLLLCFLTGSHQGELLAPLADVDELPAACRAAIRRADATQRAWTAWLTPGGPIAAWGDYDMQGSLRIHACLLFVEWWDSTSGHHAMWCYCDPKRATEWTVGRGHP